MLLEGCKNTELCAKLWHRKIHKNCTVNLIPTHEVPSLPTDFLIGWEELQEYHDIDIPFIDKEFIESNPSEKRRNEYYSSRKLFTALLNEMKLPLNEIRLKKQELGKPYALINSKMLFTSFSHSNNWVACAISENLDIGIDCEPLDRKISEPLLKRILSKSEMKGLESETKLSIWTMKEAVVKCLGTGIRTSLQKYKLTRKDDYYYVDLEEGRIHVASFKWEDHQFAVAWRVE